jgi:ubiquitin-protein ligase
MALDADQLLSVYDEIVERFGEHEAIEVTPIAGDPPEKYEITYRLPCLYKDESGDIHTSEQTIVSIDIPFGFPHFPPNCKPKTPVFHPDFDPQAICLGEYWEKTHSLAELIIIIGDMLIGKIYSSSNAFNEEAAIWYGAHPDLLPVNKIEAAPDEQSGEPEEPEPEHLPDESKEPDQDFAADELESVFSIEVDTESEIDLPESSFPGLDELADESLFDQSVPQGDPLQLEADGEPAEEVDSEAGSEKVQQIDTDRLSLLARTKRFVELDRELAALTGDHLFAEQHALVKRCADTLGKARGWYQQARELEENGDTGGALELYRQVTAMVSDYPGIAQDIDRAVESQQMLEGLDLAGGLKQSEPATKKLKKKKDDNAAPPEDKKGKKSIFASLFRKSGKKQPAATPKKKPKQPQKKSGGFYEDTLRRPLHPVIPAILAAMVMVAGVVGYIFYRDINLSQQAQITFITCQELYIQDNFTQAQQLCATAADTAHKILLFETANRDHLVDSSNRLLQSEKFRQGLAGNVLVDGTYIAKETLAKITEFETLKQSGDTLFAEKQWQEAKDAYASAVTFVRENDVIEPELLAPIEENLAFIDVQLLIASGTSHLEQQQWVDAGRDLQEALALAQSDSLGDNSEVVESISAQLEKIAVTDMIRQGDEAYATRQWASAHDYYQTALTAARQSSSPDQARINELRLRSVQATLFEAISAGRSAFSSNRWDEAIAEYGQAIEILDANEQLLRQTFSGDERQKLERIILQAAVNRDSQAATGYLESREYRNAIVKWRAVIASIEASPFKTEEEFSQISADAAISIQEAERDLLLEGRIAYLEDHFLEIFEAHFPRLDIDGLVGAQVEYTHRIGDQLIFNLQATDISSGIPARLVMNFKHDLTTGKWEFYAPE